jgi:nucleotide-binding universal stress UspA family protein
MTENPSAHGEKSARLSVRIKPGSPQDRTTSSPTDLGMVPSCLQLRHILVPVDFSESADKALRYAFKFAEQFGAKVTLLHVIQPTVYPTDFATPPTTVSALDEAVRARVEEKLASLASHTGVNCGSVVRSGQPYYEIAAAAREQDVDLIIISTHGHTGLKHVLLGSTAERVVRYAPCPVLTVREREHDFV